MSPNGFECIPSANEKRLGFLSSQVRESKRMDNCSFPIFSKEGQIDVTVKMVKVLTLAPGQLNALRQFYENIYVKALRDVYKGHIQLIPDYLPSYYFLPLTGQNTIDWACIQETNEMFFNTDRIQAYDLLRSKHSLDDYIVYTTYKKLSETEEEKQDPYVRFYLVKRTASEKWPTSKFPKRKNPASKDFDTFIDYYKMEYNLIVQDQTKPLFEVIPAGVSFFKVSYLSKKQRAAQNAIVHLVPEFCGVLPFPASYWFKLMAVPAIVFRLNSLLSAKSLKDEIERLSFNEQLRNNEDWEEFHLSPADCKAYGIVHKDEPNDEKDEVVEDVAQDDELMVELESNASECEDNQCSKSNDDDEEPMEISSSEDEEDVSDLESSSDELPSSSPVKNEVIVNNKNLTIVEPQLSKRTFPDCDDTYLNDRNFIRKYPNFNADDFIVRIETKLFQAICSLLKSRKEFSVQYENIAPVDEDVRPDLSVVVDRRVDSFDSHAFAESFEGPSTLLILQALTARHAHDFFNFERLETVGDSFLKFSTCSYLYLKYPLMSVDIMVEIKDHHVCNYNLYRLAVQKGIQKYIIYEQFEAKTYYVPPGFKANESGKDQEISDKSVADCTEALIGAYLIALGPVGAIKFMSWLGLKVADGEVSLRHKHWLPEPPPAIPDSISNRVEAEVLVDKLYRRFCLQEFEERIGYSFKSKSYLVQAFTHNSYYLNTATPCYQRLELLGDAVLDYLVTRHIYEDRVHKFSPGELSNLRQALVSNAFFACMAVKYGYHKHIMAISYDAKTAIKTFDHFNERDRKLILGSFMTDLESDDVGEIEIPKLLGDVFESVAGAIFLDSGLSLDAVFTIYYRLFQHELKTFSEKIPVAPVRKLLEMQGKVEFSEPKKLAPGEVEVTVTLSKPVEGCPKTFTGIGKTKRTARIAAAKKALKVILKPA